MKKLISVMLAAVLLLSMLPCTAAVFADSAEPLLYWSFEDTTVEALIESTGNAFYTGGTVAIAEGGFDGTGHALKITDANSGNGQWLNGLKPSTAYTVTFWAKTENRDSTAWPNFGVNEYDGNQYISEQNFTADWAKYTLSFTTGAASTQAKVYTWVFGSGKVDFFIDEVTVTEKQTAPQPPAGETLSGWDFEAGNLDTLKADAAYYQSGNVSVAAGGANGTSYALLVQNADSGNGQWLNDLKPATTYEISFWAKTANRQDGTWPNVGVSDYDGSAYIKEQNFTDAWAQYKLTFTTGAATTRAKFYTWIFGEGTVDFYLDEVTISEQTEPTEPGTLSAWNFEAGTLSALGTAENGDGDGYYGSGNLSIVTGGAEGTSYALKIANAGSGNGITITDLKPETEYAVTFWAKELNNGGKAFPSIGIKNFDGTGAYKTLSSYAKDWAMYSLQFTTGKDCTTALFYTWIFGEGTTELYLDEVRLREHSSDPFADWNFEENNIWLLGSPSGSDSDGYYASGTLSVVPDGDGHCLKISNAGSGNGKKITGLRPAANYTVKFRAKLANASGTAYPAVGVKEYYNTAYSPLSKETEPHQTVNAFTTEWQTYRLNFRTGDNSASALFYTWIFGTGTVDLLLDDVRIFETPDAQAELLPDWDFEVGAAAALGTADSTDADGYYAKGTVAIVPGDESDYCLQISGAESGNGQTVLGLDRDADYVLSFRAKLASCSADAFPNVGVNGYDGESYLACTEFTNEWADYELRFRTSDSATSACVYTWIFGSGEAELLLDNVSLRRATDWLDEKDPVDDYSYAFAVVGDPQIINQYYPEKLPVIFDWLTENAEARKISYVFSMGDSTHYDTDAEWTRITENYRRLDGLVPYTVVRGNHDSPAQYEKYFGIDGYMNQFAGSYRNKPENTWRTLTAGTKTYLIMSLDNGASDDVLGWAGEIISAHPDCSVIITTHSYLAPDGSFNVGNSPKSLGCENDPIDLWQKFICKYKNIQLVLCGHESSEQLVLSRMEGEAGNTVTALMIDGQETDAAQNYGPYGGAGLVALLCFSEDGSRVEVEYYSTLREQYFMERNQFTFALESDAKDPCEGYTDINRSSWYHTAADFAIENGYMGSTKTDKLVFEPNTKVSRAMVASIMYRIAGSPDVEYKGSFTDVPSGKWFTAAIEWAAQNGLASGKGAGKFDPNGNVTRQELAVFMYKLADFRGRAVSAAADLSEFEDAAKVPAWAKSYVQWAVADGLISGKSSNGRTLLAPVDNATRAEFASIIMRFMQKA